MSPCSNPGFVKLTFEEIAELPSLLSQRLPKSAQFYNVVQLFLRHKFEEEQEFFRYSELDKDETCYLGRVVTHNKVHWITLPPISNSTDVMTRLVQDILVHLDWSRSISFNAVDNVMASHLTTSCSTVSDVTATLYYMSVYYMPFETALNMDVSLPPQSEIRPLNRMEMDIAFKNWIYASANPDVSFIRDSALQLGSLGLVVRGVLVSWGMNLRDGGIHVVHTLKEHRGRGYGKTLMRHLCKSTAESGQFSVVHIEDWNESSIRLMKAIGFTYSHSITWTEYDFDVSNAPGIEASTN